MHYAITGVCITDGENILDSTGIHPESYNIALELLKSLNLNTKIDIMLESKGKDESLFKLLRQLKFYQLAV